MRIVVLSQYYPPEIGAPQRRLSELASFFRRKGHTVMVLTAMPNYPGGRIHEGYGGLFKRETLDGIEVLRSFIFPTQRTNYVHRLANYFSFVLSSIVVGMLFLPRAEYLIVESPPLFLGMAGVLLSKWKRAKLIFNVSDLWPESATRLGVLKPDGIAFRLSSWLERFCYRQAWVVSGQSVEILSNIKGRFPDYKTYHLSNGVDTAKFGHQTRSERARSRLGAPGDVVFLYAGLHGLAQGLDQVLDAAGRLRGNSGYRFVLIGDGPEKNGLSRRASAEGLSSMDFLDPVSPVEMPALVASADVVLVVLKRYIPGAVPSKLYEAMASGRPVILVAEGEAARILLENNAGLVVTPGDIQGLVRAMERLRKDRAFREELGANGRRVAVRDFDRAMIADRFIRFLEMRGNS